MTNPIVRVVPSVVVSVTRSDRPNININFFPAASEDNWFFVEDNGHLKFNDELMGAVREFVAEFSSIRTVNTDELGKRAQSVVKKWVDAGLLVVKQPELREAN